MLQSLQIQRAVVDLLSTFLVVSVPGKDHKVGLAIGSEDILDQTLHSHVDTG